ncbi:MetQ/NlpA family ABC transporter substrate-binding protein [Corynebacterium doosanense]|uniref:ABC transporter substrate-binding protein n=1 Tax=Corynebacterium doosanense CAU 212 = DSM 45436 TaxID=558173 RepID=A0A097IH88_9CORY|nr:MetQ/NlpA family ABC transporter substrate-binding protein [Corynebacterium doosanense]AIT61492.1 ABC transporter substrate-binding protein [Corynebacterium doosanense CAU 212 = DSM 45436]
MKTTLRLSALACALAASAALAGCSNADDTTTLRIAASSTPHAEILQHAEDAGMLGDTDLDISIMSRAAEGNIAVSNGSLDLNYLQHTPFFDDWVAESDVENLVNLGDVHLEPQSIYSRDLKSVADIPDGAQILVPQSGSDYARALLILEDAGLLTLDRSGVASLSALTDANIAENPRNLKITGVEDDVVPHAMEDPDVTAAVMSSNYALQAGIVDLAIFTESAENSPYGNIVVASAGSADSAEVAELMSALQSPEMAEWIRAEYDGVVIPTH